MTRARRAVWVGLVAGTVLVALAYVLAGQATKTGEQAKFFVLWAGLLAFLWPAARRLADPMVEETERFTILAAGGLFTYLPKFLRSPGEAVFYDEIAHSVQVDRLVDGGEPFRDNPLVSVVPSFPGLHTLAAGLRELTGLGTWQVAVVLVASLHVVGVVGVVVLVRRVTGSRVVASLSGLLWAVAPGALFFNTQFAYQSLAIVWFVWAAAAVVEAQASTGRTRLAWTLVAGLLTVVVAFTHHLTSYSLVLLLVLLTGASLVASRWGEGDEMAPRTWVPAASVLGFALAAVGLWSLARDGSDESIADYLSPYPRGGLDQLWDAITGSGDRRTFFTRSGLPGWEKLAGLAAPLLAIGLALVGLMLLRRMIRRPGSAMWGLTVLAGLYVAALPFLLTPTGSQGAHRSFPFTYLGIALLAGAGLAKLIERWLRSPGRTHLTGGLAVAALLVVLAMGNTAANVNEFDRFPGPWEAGADSRSLTPELASAAEWLRDEETTARVVADLYSGTAFGALGTVRNDCAVAAACPGDLEIWRFYDGSPIRRSDIALLADEGYRYLVVDKRMAESTPRSGFWFNREEAGAFEHDEPYPAEALTRFEGMPWLRKVFASTSFDVYAIDVDGLGADVLEGEPGEAGTEVSDADEPAEEEDEDAEDGTDGSTTTTTTAADGSTTTTAADGSTASGGSTTSTSGGSSTSATGGSSTLTSGGSTTTTTTAAV